MVWVFQDGNLAGLFDVTPTGFIDVTTPLLMFCIAFGLSMDYEVFLLSRIKEEYDLEHDNEEAVAVGLDHTGRIVTAAAVLLAIVFIAIATSDVSVVKLFGLGLTLGGAGRRLPHPCHARSGGDEAGRAGQLVGAEVPAAVPPPVGDLGERAPSPSWSRTWRPTD